MQKVREETLVYTEAGVRLMQCVPLIRGPINTGFTVCEMKRRNVITQQINCINLGFRGKFTSVT